MTTTAVDGAAARRARRRLRPIELTEGVILGDVSLALCVVGRFLPGGSILRVIAIVPFATIGARHRPRAVLAAGIAAAAVSFLVAGGGIVVSVLGCAVLGGLVGVAARRGWGPLRTGAASAAVVWPPVAAGTVALLLVFSNLRTLTLDQIHNSWAGTARFLRNLGLDRIASVGTDIVRFVVDYWWVFIPLALLASIVTATIFARMLAGPVLRRVEVAAPRLRRRDFEPGPATVDGAGPVPVTLDDASFAFPGSTRPALRHVSATVGAGELVAVVGPNGSGKSTLLSLLAGTAPTEGSVQRPGAVGLGRRRGTGLIFQRPEAQVLGVRVRDDVVWGLPPDAPVDVHAALDRVGLAGFADRETATLSGGELQRLAIAAALAREPALLLSDESTSMIDHAGRERSMTMFRALTTDDGLAVVHVTHDVDEAARADRVVELDHGSATDRAAPHVPRVHSPLHLAARPHRDHDALITLDRVGYVYSPGTPWAHRALSGVDLAIDAGEGVLVVGLNGSGKSTLAWLLAGLLVPTEGTVLVDGTPPSQRVGRVGLSLQHARLQLLRPTVADDVAAASSADAIRVGRALDLVGLPPARFRRRRIDELSGGEQRRVAIAGLIAAEARALVLDEPFAGLDHEGRDGLVRVLARLRAEANTTLVLISHDLHPAVDVVDRVVRLRAGEIMSDDDIVRDPQSTTEADRGH
jgi:energy-coupling factor transport system ATP-binding protein